MLLGKLIFRLFSYTKFYWLSQSNHYIHSPFVFQWLEHIHNWEDEKLTSYRNALSLDSSAFTFLKGSKTHTTSVNKRYSQTSIDEVYGKILSATSFFIKAKTFLELGTSLGVSAAYIVKSNHSIVGNTIDYNPLATKLASSLFNEFFPGHRVKFENGLFLDVLPSILNEMKTVDLVFIDGDHSFEATLDNVEGIRPYLSENSVIILDDIRWSKGMFKAWNEVIVFPEFNYTIDFGRIGLLFKVNNHSPKQHFYIH